MKYIRQYVIQAGILVLINPITPKKYPCLCHCRRPTSVHTGLLRLASLLPNDIPLRLPRMENGNDNPLPKLDV